MSLDFKNAAIQLKEWTIRKSPEILVGAGIAGFTFSVIDAIRVTPLAVDLIENKKKELEVEELTVTDTIKTTWKLYLPVVVSATASTACIVCSNRISSKRSAVIATAYALSETTLKEYKQKVIDTLGEKKERAIEDSIADDHIKKNPPSTQQVIITTKGDTLCYDDWSGRYFKSDVDSIKRAVNELNEQLVKEMYVSLNEFYFKLGLQCTSMGNELGWNIEDGLIDIHFSYHGADDGTPCLVMEYHIQPKFDYTKLY